MGPGAIGKYDRELRAIEGIGLTDVAMDVGHVAGAVRSAFETARVRAEQSGDAWWESVSPTLSRVLDAEGFPQAVRVGTAASDAYQGAFDPEHAFEFGLARLLDGIEAFVTARA